jgi:hypothetical protein
MEQSLHFIAVLSSFLFTGAAIYINLVEHPARMSCGSEIAATVFPPSYRRAAPFQITLALVATITGTLAWLVGGHVLWLAGALLIFSVIPYTLLVIMPVNKQLLDPALNRNSPATSALLERWNRLHGIRSLAGLMASCLFLALAMQD